MRGIVRLYEGTDWRCRKLIWQRENLVVNSGLVALANLLGNQTTGNMVSAVGFGSGNVAPISTDVALTSSPAYYNAVGAIVIGPAGGVPSGSVLFNYALLTTDYAANPLTIQELGLFGNTGTASLPAATGTTNAAWAASTAFTVGNLIVDSNGNIQRCTTAGTSKVAPHPTWATTIGVTTNDGSAVWTLTAVSTAPVPMIAHVVVPAFPYAGAGNYSGTWTISM